MPKISLEELKKDKEIHANLIGQSVTFKTTWGLFCPEEIDSGTKLLLASLEKVPSPLLNRGVLDIGCGYGPIGISLAKAHPEAGVDMIDKDFVAIEYSEKNIEANKVPNAHAFLSNGFSHVPQAKTYGLIVSNLPAKVSKEFFWILFGEALDHMDSGSQIVVVVIKQLETMIKKNFKTLFNNSEVLDRDDTYSVIAATKN